MPTLTRCLFLGLCVLVLLETATAQNSKTPRCRPPCPSNAVCINGTQCTCKDGFASGSGKKYFSDVLEICEDINECAPPISISCGMNADCKNTEGSYYCMCIDGYELPTKNRTFLNASFNDCQDIDECQLNSSLCAPYGICIKTHGQYMCKCKSGFAKSIQNEAKECIDRDECSEPKICQENETCVNSIGSYACNCKQGFARSNEKNQSRCIDVDECRLNSSLCAPHGVCMNTPLGSYSCECTLGFTKSSKDQFKECIEISFPSWTPPPGISKEFLKKMALMEKKFKTASAHQSIEWFVEDIEELLTMSRDFEQLPLEVRLQVATHLLSSLEEILLGLADAMPNGPLVSPTPGGTELTMNIQENPSGMVELGRSHTKMKLDWNLARKQDGPKKAVIGLFSTKKLETLLADAPLALDPEKQRALQQENEDALVGGGIPILLSAVSTAFLSNRDTQNLSSPVTFAFSHEVKPTGPRKEVICAFWEHDNNGSGHWATTGCEKLGSQGNSTTCRCTHLSSFAILMAQYDVEDWKLSVITQVGLGVSLVCLLLCIITFLLCRPIQGSRTTIHLHLCLCLFVGSTVFLVGTANPSQGQAPVGLRCRLVAGLLHYCFLAAFCWMCLEGLELYFLVVRVFPGPALRTRWLCLLGYGTPAVIVAISAAVNSQGYGRPRFCWLSLEKGFIWSFLGPITLIIAFNAFIFVITVWKLTQKFSEIHPDMKKLKKARMLTFTAMAQLCILGCTWIFGLFLFGPHSRVLAYIFTILNCFQGCFLFLLHCLLNKKVREEYRRWACIVTKNKYNEFSTSTTSQSRALRPSLESGM
ncbi:adhesion G protein-coupled receptor E5 isoform X1 [Monodelphis domestica]|uniref:Adhesion G protein-coupled receptor E5 n=1 Tax=Monodelphis domestica TaxID=13616 RepID=A0A5F8G271_MONDO|nr:adhesion G protein-coupled receptor E5 isoform X1 [Monodelphis domestica]XP_056678562.1 adhesion G protein-coupled receptor E5 isoform X1 [Monodelphis domestica]XP_056678563.1 adhesion G protein-coupled receptor E5 isoform X1 [Monodelphis domestica]